MRKDAYEDPQKPFRFAVTPYLGDDDKRGVAYYRVYDDATPVCWVVLGEDDDGDESLEYGYDSALMYRWWREEYANRCTYATFMCGVAASFSLLHPYDNEMSYEGWMECVIEDCPPLCDEEYLLEMPSKRLRNMSNAMGCKPSSIKKQDVVDAIVSTRKNWVDEPTFPFLGSNEYLVIECNENEAGTPDAKIYDSFDGSTKPLASEQATHRGPYIYGTHRRDILHAVATMQNDARREISLAQNAGIQLDNADKTLSMLSFECALQTSWQQLAVKTMHEKLAEANQKVEAMDKMVSSIRLVREPIVPSEDTVLIGGREYEYYGHANTPPAINNYAINFWTASQRFGTGANRVEFDAHDLMDAMFHNRVTSLVGPPGTGKTSIVRQVGHMTGCPVSIVQFTRDKPVEQLIGVDKIQSGQQVFIDGEITAAMRAAAQDPNTPHFVVFDEFDHAPPEIQSEFHGVVEGRAYTLPTGEVIPVHDNLRFVLTRNTTGHGDQNGRHASANVSDSAFNSRIHAAFMVDYMKEEHESTLMVSYGLDVDEAKEIVSFANSTRDSVAKQDSGESFDGMSEAVCLRHLMAYAAARLRGVDKQKAIASTIISQLPERDRQVANELCIARLSSL